MRMRMQTANWGIHCGGDEESGDHDLMTSDKCKS